MRASPDARKKPGALIHIGKIVPLMITSHPKNRRRKCINPISENTITAMVVNGFIIRSFLSRKVLSITYLYSVELFTIISGLKGEYFRKDSALFISIRYLAFQLSTCGYIPMN